ncbi:MAG: dTDP-4-dehydrorhamnose reductase [Desulfovibrionaceae bacterium]
MLLQGACVPVLGGRRGLLGQAMVAALTEAGARPLPLGREDLDPLARPEALSARLADLLDEERPPALVNAVAYTQVDKAEDEPEAAFRLNRDLPALLASLAAPRGVAVVHFGTDFVFDGRRHSPYDEDQEPRPLSVYGQSKLAGERAVLESGARALVARTAWLFGPGKGNFVHKILTLAATRKTLGVVHDQMGSPTYTPDLARHTVQLMAAGAVGLFHVVNSGRASWCELAAEAVSAAGLHCRVEPIPTSAYPTKATRPAFSVLDTARFTRATGVTPRPWLQALRDYVFRDLAEELAALRGPEEES